MQKRGLVVCLILSVLLISLSFVSASSLNEWSKGFIGGITGNAIAGNCQGCMANEQCVPIGYRFSDNGNKYCDISGIVEQKSNAVTCYNDFECSSNSCSEGKCLDVVGTNSGITNLLCGILHPFSEENRIACRNGGVVEDKCANVQCSENEICNPNTGECITAVEPLAVSVSGNVVTSTSGEPLQINMIINAVASDSSTYSGKIIAVDSVNPTLGTVSPVAASGKTFSGKAANGGGAGECNVREDCGEREICLTKRCAELTEPPSEISSEVSANGDSIIFSWADNSGGRAETFIFFDSENGNRNVLSAAKGVNFITLGPAVLSALGEGLVSINVLSLILSEPPSWQRELILGDIHSSTFHFSGIRTLWPVNLLIRIPSDAIFGVQCQENIKGAFAFYMGKQLWDNLNPMRTWDEKNTCSSKTEYNKFFCKAPEIKKLGFSGISKSELIGKDPNPASCPFLHICVNDQWQGMSCQPSCGNNEVDGVGEECDDGNQEDGDGCSALCQLEDLCGNGVIDDDEECEPPDLVNSIGRCEDLNPGTFGDVYCGTDCTDDYSKCSKCSASSDYGCAFASPGDSCTDSSGNSGGTCILHDGGFCSCEQSCGDGTCDLTTEDCESCPSDCGSCCGDGTCDLTTEDCYSCSIDCGEPGPYGCGASSGASALGEVFSNVGKFVGNVFSNVEKAVSGTTCNWFGWFC